MYWKNGVDFQIEYALKDGVLKKDQNAEDFYQQGQTLYEVVASRPGLVNLINSCK